MHRREEQLAPAVQLFPMSSWFILVYLEYYGHNIDVHDIKELFVYGFDNDLVESRCDINDASGINVASTFNRTLMAQHGAAMGAEFRGKGVNVALGPMMNIVRAPAAGRNWESRDAGSFQPSFGGDPYLSGEAAFEVITGIQSQGVQGELEKTLHVTRLTLNGRDTATAKHYINNEQEHFRDSSSSNVDDSNCSVWKIKVRSDIFSKAFWIDLPSSPVNSSYSCENDKTLNGILKGEFGFPGYVMSDWWATHSTLSVNKGLDASIPPAF
ncbi:hypothetical protein DXG01_000048 [Tephrocybe rancida]|nr:hypothetical protein DXG01_000048 [Tephrocybe rancida]